MRNLSTQESKQGVTIEDRNRKEAQFFSTTQRWTDLNKEQVDIGALKTFLGDLLYDRIRAEFPAVVSDIKRLSLKTDTKSRLLGPSRQTSVEQRRFLTHVASTYQHEVDKTLRGNYQANLDTFSPIKHRKHLRKHADDFAKAMATRGHKMAFRTTKDLIDPHFQNLEPEVMNIYEWVKIQYLHSRGSELPGTVNPGDSWGHVPSAVRPMEEYSGGIYQ